MKTIELHDGEIALVDDQDYERINQWRWTHHKVKGKRGFAGREFARKGVRTHITMHKEVLGTPPPGFVWDHINRNRLDNRKCNLRPATRQQNNCNRAKFCGTSKYKGVCLDDRGDGRPWRAGISYRRIKKYLGHFKTEEEAARAYDEVARKEHGEYACLNFQDRESSIGI